jgi:hypothetical protein
LIVKCLDERRDAALSYRPCMWWPWQGLQSFGRYPPSAHHAAPVVASGQPVVRVLDPRRLIARPLQRATYSLHVQVAGSRLPVAPSAG